MYAIRWVGCASVPRGPGGWQLALRILWSAQPCPAELIRGGQVCSLLLVSAVRRLERGAVLTLARGGVCLACSVPIGEHDFFVNDQSDYQDDGQGDYGFNHGGFPR